MDQLCYKALSVKCLIWFSTYVSTGKLYIPASSPSNYMQCRIIINHIIRRLPLHTQYTPFSLLSYICSPFGIALQWRHNGSDCVSNHQPREYLLDRLIRCRSKKTSKLRVTGLCAANSPETGEFPAQRASNAEMFPFDDVIMVVLYATLCHIAGETQMYWVRSMPHNRDTTLGVFNTIRPSKHVNIHNGVRQ